jgi:hypothetical protein
VYENFHQFLKSSDFSNLNLENSNRPTFSDRDMYTTDSFLLTYLLTYLLTNSRVQDIITQLVKKYPAFFVEPESSLPCSQ